MRILDRLSIRNKLLLLVGVLLLPLIYFSTLSLIEQVKNQNKLTILYSKIQRTELTSDVISVIQNERFLSTAYVGSDGKLFHKELILARKKTDKQLVHYKNFLNDSEENATPQFVIALRLGNYREAVDKLKIDSSRATLQYTDIIMHLLEDIEHTALLVKEYDLQNDIYAFLYLLRAKECLGQMRAMVMKAFTTKSFSRKEYGAFSVQKASFDLYVDDFLSEATSEASGLYSKLVKDKSFGNVISTISLIYERGEIDMENQTPQSWYTSTTFCMDSLHRISSHKIDDLERKMVNLLLFGRRQMIIFTSSIIFLVAISLFLAIYFIQYISKSLVKLKEASERISDGDTNVNLQIKSHDEIGALSKSFNKMSENINQQANVASEIGKGNYAIDIMVRGDRDILGNSLKKMKTNLLDFAFREKKRTWELNLDSELNDLMRGQRSIDVLLNKIVIFICEKFNIQIGILYMMSEEDKLNVEATYGTDSDELKAKNIDYEGSQVGMALERENIIQLKDVPDSYFKIYSGLISGVPKHVIWIPLIFEEFKIGVLELASANELPEENIKFLKSEAAKISMVLIGLKAVERTNQLLKESQNQAEMLTAQQETLKEVNDELVFQKNKLQSSEEELKSSQEELQEKNMELEEKASLLEEQYEELRVKNHQLEEARKSIEDNLAELELTSKYKSEFLANMSHELRTPLNSILILSKLLQDANNGIPEKQREYAKIINQSGSDLLKLINDILDLSKIESGSLNAEYVETLLQDFLMKDQFLHMAQEKQIRFITKINKGLPEKIYTDRFRVQQILKNLLSNAFKFTPVGGKVSVEIGYAKKDELFKSETLNSSKKVIFIAVSDSGVGIAEEKQSLIFDAFQQEDTSTSRKYGGTGLGLSISKELAMLLGGEIHLKSIKGEGSVFTLFLPEKKLKEEEVETEEGEEINKQEISQPANEQPDQNQNSKVLIIEDDKQFSRVLSDIAESRGFNTIVVHGGKEAIEKAYNELPGSIILDIGLPDMNGWDVLEKIRENVLLKDVPIHILSGETDKGYTEKMSNVWFEQKPIGKDVLEKTFSEIEKLNNKGLKQILIVEKDEQLGKEISHLFHDDTIMPSQVFKISSAIKEVQTKRFDCVIIDFDLSEESFDLLRTIRKDERNFKVPVIIYSGEEFSEEDERKIRKYTEAIILKTPQSYERLKDEVNLFLHHVQDSRYKGNAVKDKLISNDETIRNKKILIADDDIRNVYALYNVLESEGMKVISANDGKEALEKLTEHKDVDLVLMDIMMPEMDGYEAMRKIREMPAYKSIPIIALTAKAMKGDKEKSIQAGASDYVSKPMDVERLLSLMRVWLYESRKR